MVAVGEGSFRAASLNNLPDLVTLTPLFLVAHISGRDAEDGVPPARSFGGLQEMTMGINARCSDVKTELVERVTRSREDLEWDLRNQIRQGHLSVMDYLTNHKGYKPEHARVLEPKFRKSIHEAAA
jgi:hypothetical protein